MESVIMRKSCYDYHRVLAVVMVAVIGDSTLFFHIRPRLLIL